MVICESDVAVSQLFRLGAVKEANYLTLDPCLLLLTVALRRGGTALPQDPRLCPAGEGHPS